MSNDDNMIQLLLADRIKGLNFYEIGAKHGIPPVEVRQMVSEALAEVVTRDPVEMRGIIQLRLEAITNKLWDGLEQGSFDNANIILKAVERMAELMDLNEQTIKHSIQLVSDEETIQIFQVLKMNNQYIFDRVRAMSLGQKAQLELEAWPEWSADAATQAVDEIILEAEVLNVGVPKSLQGKTEQTKIKYKEIG